MNDMNHMTLDRNGLGCRYFAKEDGSLYSTVATGIFDAEGKMTYEDKVVSNSFLDSQGALTLQEYKKVDEIVTKERENPRRFTAWMRSLKNNVENFDGMKFKTYWYNVMTGKTTSRSTMDMEDDAPGTSVSMAQYGVPLPLEFADWLTNIRRDPSASMAAGYDTAAEKASWAAKSVADGLDLRQINGWGGLTYNGVTVYGLRDVPATLTQTQTGTTTGWLAAATPQQIYSNIVAMVKTANTNKIPGPYALVLPESFRFRLAETYSESDLTGEAKSLWMKLLEKPSANIPNVLDISEIVLVPEMDELKGGAAPTYGEAYLVSLDPRCFKVLNYLPMQSFTIDLNGMISTKHRVVEGICPLFKKNTAGIYGVVKLSDAT